MARTHSVPGTNADLSQVEQRIRAYLDSTDTLLLNVADAVRLTQLSANTIWRSIASGELVHLRFGRRVMIDPDDLVAWIRQHRMRGPYNA